MASVLLVCTGNICRTPMAEGFLREHLHARSPGETIAVGSCGVIAVDGNPPTPEAVRAAGERDVDIAAQRARRLSTPLVERSDLVIAMSQEHVAEVVRLVPSAVSKTFTLKELLYLARDLPAVAPVEGGERGDDELLRARVAEAHALRQRRPTSGLDLDVSDPLGMSLETYRATAWELDTLLGELVEALLGRLPARTSMWDDE
jgi:protein-tyrosine phosphatase